MATKAAVQVVAGWNASASLHDKVIIPLESALGVYARTVMTCNGPLEAVSVASGSNFADRLWHVNISVSAAVREATRYQSGQDPSSSAKMYAQAIVAASSNLTVMNGTVSATLPGLRSCEMQLQDSRDNVTSVLGTCRSLPPAAFLEAQLANDEAALRNCTTSSCVANYSADIARDRTDLAERFFCGNVSLSIGAALDRGDNFASELDQIRVGVTTLAGLVVDVYKKINSVPVIHDNTTALLGEVFCTAAVDDIKYAGALATDWSNETCFVAQPSCS